MDSSHFIVREPGFDQLLRQGDFIFTPLPNKPTNALKFFGYPFLNGQIIYSLVACRICKDYFHFDGSPTCVQQCFSHVEHRHPQEWASVSPGLPTPQNVTYVNGTNLISVAANKVPPNLIIVDPKQKTFATQVGHASGTSLSGSQNERFSEKAGPRQERCGTCVGCMAAPCLRCPWCINGRPCIHRRCLKHLEMILNREAPRILRRVGCGICQSCTVSDCNVCLPCVDRLHFDGQFLNGCLCRRKTCLNQPDNLPRQKVKRQQGQKAIEKQRERELKKQQRLLAREGKLKLKEEKKALRLKAQKQRAANISMDVKSSDDEQDQNLGVIFTVATPRASQADPEKDRVDTILQRLYERKPNAQEMAFLHLLGIIDDKGTKLRPESSCDDLLPSTSLKSSTSTMESSSTSDLSGRISLAETVKQLERATQHRLVHAEPAIDFDGVILSLDSSLLNLSGYTPTQRLTGKPETPVSSSVLQNSTVSIPIVARPQVQTQRPCPVPVPVLVAKPMATIVLPAKLVGATPLPTLVQPGVPSMQDPELLVLHQHLDNFYRSEDDNTALTNTGNVFDRLSNGTYSLSHVFNNFD